jgi:hypothetical protein
VVVVVELVQVKLHVLMTFHLLEVVACERAMDYPYYFYLILSLLEMVLDEQYQIIFLSIKKINQSFQT